MAVFGVGVASVKSFILKKGAKEASKMFSKTVKSKLIARGAPTLVTMATFELEFAIGYSDIGTAAANWFDSKDKYPKNERVDFY